ncbi:MAG: RdgB/HAM1 family non-canonical purine NTP pyrophosphatase [Prevotella sp.]|nr:RdgB/HAM1 family non-canonical purine NTP pyrophosphatase [Bacteroides sp.]MCM1366199.1 RdgB/HAM1 family non-canonical purine NTP pyrophosphatase [Prevotella sp.]MCM1436951.1 RdgB/HAM1 family non-canonical purine NTP pyrophosphatase [Prevotella sp.]
MENQTEIAATCGSPNVEKLIFASNNPHKLEEVRAILGNDISVESLEEAGCHEELPETSDTIAGNALQKARRVYELFGIPCFADDTGLCVEALNGAPGVYTARYAGPQCSPDDNIALMLRNMAGESNRNARFITIIALIDAKGEHLFEGEVKGKIAYRRHGDGGFGYDPIFIPDETGVSFAEMTPDDKNKISHRGRATRLLAKYIQSPNLAK